MEHIVKILSAIVLCISGIAFLGHIFGLSEMYAWGGSSLSTPASLCFILNGIAIFLISKHLPKSNGI